MTRTLMAIALGLASYTAALVTASMVHQKDATLKITTVKQANKKVSLDLTPVKSGSDLRVRLSISNNSARNVVVIPLEPDRLTFEITAEDVARIPAGAKPFLKNLEQEDLIRLAPGNELSAEFLIKSFYRRVRKAGTIRAWIHEYAAGQWISFESSSVELP